MPSLWLWPLCALCVINHSTVFYLPIFSSFFFHLKWFAIINGATNDTVGHNGIIGVLFHFSNFMFARKLAKTRRRNERNCEHDWTSFEQSTSIRFFLNECDNQTPSESDNSEIDEMFLTGKRADQSLDYIHSASCRLNGWYFDSIIILC